MPHIFSHKGTKIYSHHSVDSYPDANVFNMHAHDWLEILYCISGKGNYIVEDSIYSLEPGDIFIIRPGEMHKLQIDSSSTYERIVIRFSPDLFDDYSAKDALLKIFYDRRKGQHNRHRIDDLNIVKTAFSNYEFKNIYNIELNLLGRLILILTALEGIYTSSEESVSSNIQSKLLSYVDEHLFDNISVGDIAEAFGKSRSQINRIFSRMTGKSLWDYVITKRLMAARTMIQSGESAHEACNDCGFSDYSAFYRAYKARFGNSPRDDAPK